MTERAESARTADNQLIDSVWWTMRVAFGLMALFAGIDKFFNLLAHWSKYIAPKFADAMPIMPQHFMYIVGVVEIIVGLGLLLTPWTKVFAYVVALWLLVIAVNLLGGGFYDIAVRDIVMAASAVSLARLTSVVPAASTASRRRPFHTKWEAATH
jgi:uncharacterized membrane protein YphA (DoxX/SURF4 family)